MKQTYYTPNVGVPASAVTVTIPASIVPQGNTTGFKITFDPAPGCAATVANIARIRVLAGNQAFIDVGLPAFNAWKQRFAPRHCNDLGTGKVLSIPMEFLDEKGQRRRKVCQVPPNMPISIQIVFGVFVAGVAESMHLLTIQDPDVAPQYSPLLIGNAMNIAAAQNNRIYDPKMEGLLRAIIINTTGLAGLSFTAAGRQLYDQIEGLALYAEELDHQAADGVTGAVNNPVCVKQPMVPMNEGNAKAVITTAAAWAGIANEMTLYLIQREGPEGEAFQAKAAAGAAVA